ncbi:MAG: kelch repeat-containing protein [Thermoplasmata archaeon]
MRWLSRLLALPPPGGIEGEQGAPRREASPRSKRIASRLIFFIPAAVFIIILIAYPIFATLTLSFVPEATIVGTWEENPDGIVPEARSGHAVTYDSAAGRLILFGGFLDPNDDSVASDETWAYDAQSKEWSQASPGTAPSPRGGSALAYDAESDRSVLFGGRSGNETYDDTWGFDANAGSWSLLAPTMSPPPLSGHAMVYDSESDRLVLFGGILSTTGATSSQTWTYDFNANSWTLMPSDGGPAGRREHAMAYHSRLDLVVLFGGKEDGSSRGDTWEYDLNGNNWTQVIPRSSPSQRFGHAMAYDVGRDLVILFAGRAAGETWVYDSASRNWQEVEPPTVPPRRQGHAMAYDEGVQRTVLFGGFALATNTLLGDTWTVVMAGRSAPNLDNYGTVLTSTDTINLGGLPKPPPYGSLVHNAIWIAIHLPMTLFGGLFLAILLRQTRGASIVKASIFLGMVTPMIVGGVILRYLFEEGVGIIPQIFGALGIVSLSGSWMAQPTTLLYGLIFGSVWMWLGFSMIIYSAGLTTIPRDYFEAARIDGASTFRTFWKITFPLLKPITLVVVTMTILWELKLFDIVIAATNAAGGVGGSADVLALQMFRYEFRDGRTEVAATVATLLTVLTLVATVWLLRRLSRR